MFTSYKCNYRLIPSGLKSDCQPFELSINKSFKNLIKGKYRQVVIITKL